MQKRRVVITGMGSVSPYGYGNKLLTKGIEEDSNPFTNLEVMVSKNKYEIFPTGIVPTNDKYVLPREIDRTMSPLSIYAYYATDEALKMSGLHIEKELYDKIGVSISSTLPSVQSYHDLFYDYLYTDPKSMPSTMPFKTMNHTSSLNISSAFGFRGRCLSPSSACAGGLQSIILGYEAIAFNRENIMVCGGTEEYHSLLTLIFNKLGIATNTECKPFHLNRDGIIVSEGAGILILEEYEHAINRNANIIAEILGTGINTSSNISFSDESSIYKCMKQALYDSSLKDSSNINYINAHATGTIAGDINEGKAIDTFISGKQRGKIIVNSLKSYFGHTMAASGSLELIATILGLYSNKFYSTKCSHFYDHSCGNLNISRKYTGSDLSGELNSVSKPILLKNSFGLGGINTSIIIQL